MRWPGVAVCGLLVLGRVGSAMAQAPEIKPTLRSPSNYIQLQVRSGRLSLAPRQNMRTRFASSSSHNDRHERLTVDLTSVQPSLSYELTTPDWQLVVRVRNQDDFHIFRQIHGPTELPSFEMRQQGEGGISFSWKSHEQRRQGNYSTIWHLLLAERDSAQEHLVPILEYLRPGMNLPETIDRIADLLVANAGRPTVPWTHWGRLVAQLSDEKYSRRRAADRELRSEGKAILSFLDQLSLDKLDFEQRHRIQQIRRALNRGDDNDAPEVVAMWLGSDPRVWLSLLSDSNAQRRRVAAEQLAQLLGKPIEFDPDGDAETRSRQIQTLREMLEAGLPEDRGS